MKFFFENTTNLKKISLDCLLAFTDSFEQIEDFSFLGKEFLAIIKEGISREDFRAEKGENLVLNTYGFFPSYKFILMGLGKKACFDFFSLYQAVALGIKKAQEGKPKKIGIAVPSWWGKKFGPEKTIQAIVEAIFLSSYRFLKYKSEEEKKKNRPIEEIVFFDSLEEIQSSEKGLQQGITFSQAVIFARDLINEPPEVTNPEYLASIALALGEESGGKIKARIFSEEEIKKLGMKAFLSVAKGSEKKPLFIRLSYQGAKPKRKIVLVGKGITFDTGGLSLKSYEAMETMKLDMAGAAAVLAVFKVIAKISPPVELVGLIPACENMPSGKALKPGDILTAMNGKTIEVLNTDAEGRLTLADAFSYAVLKEKPNEIIDLATLTGACMIALGQEIAGLFGNSEKLLKAIEEAALESGERIWRLPLFEGYKELLKSHIADIKNVQSGKYGGAITAALFLAEFVKDTPWVHLDIAGPAYAEKDSPLVPAGGVGFGVRTLLAYLSSF